MKTIKLLFAIILLFLISFNKVKAQDISLEKYNPNVPKTLSYVVKAETGENYLPDHILELFEVFDLQKSKDGNTYYLGVYNSKGKAELYKHSLIISGISEAEVVAYFRQKQISMEDAITLASNHNEYDDQYVKIDAISIEDLNKILDISIYAAKYYYSINVNVVDASKAVDALQSLGTISVSNFSDGAQYFSVGKFKSYEQAMKERENMITNGCNDVYISAYIDANRVSIDYAKELEAVYNNTMTTSMKE